MSAQTGVGFTDARSNAFRTTLIVSSSERRTRPFGTSANESQRAIRASSYHGTNSVKQTSLLVARKRAGRTRG